jgi:hypothetical protein
MARPGLGTHRKFLRLARSLSQLYTALDGEILARGVLDALWTPAYESGSDFLGDPEDIAARCKWRLEPMLLVDALATCGGQGTAGFIEQRGEPPWFIHDLWDHAPDYVRRRAARELQRHQRGTTTRDLLVAAGRKRAALAARGKGGRFLVGVPASPAPDRSEAGAPASPASDRRVQGVSARLAPLQAEGGPTIQAVEILGSGAGRLLAAREVSALVATSLRPASDQPEAGTPFPPPPPVHDKEEEGRAVTKRDELGATESVKSGKAGDPPREAGNAPLCKLEASPPVCAPEPTLSVRRADQAGLPLGPIGVVPATPPREAPPPPLAVPEPAQEAEEAFPEVIRKALVSWSAAEDVRLEVYGARPGRVERPPDTRVAECVRCHDAHEGRAEWIRQTARRWNLEDPTGYAKRRNPRGSSSVFFAPSKAEGGLTQWESFQRAEERTPEPAEPVPAPETGDAASRAAWGRVLERLEQDGKAYVATYLQRLAPMQLVGDELRVAAPDRFCRAWVVEHCSALLDEALAQVAPGVHLVLTEAGPTRASA